MRIIQGKTVSTAIFIIGLCVVNIVAGKNGILQAATPKETLGGPVFGVEDGAAGAGNIEEGGSMHREVMVYDASVVSPGQLLVDANASPADVVKKFSLPARGINWGAEHPHRAVDIAGRCGSPLYAVAAGRVQEVRTGWNGGYGIYADIDNYEGVVTRYAHAKEITVVEGQMVAAGDIVGYMGSTGDSTGCHVHFEVRGPAGAPNPFVKK